MLNNAVKNDFCRLGRHTPLLFHVTQQWNRHSSHHSTQAFNKNVMMNSYFLQYEQIYS